MKRHEHATPYARIRLAALDLDGTLLRRDMTLSDRSRRAIARVLACQVQLQGKNYYLTDAAAITAKSVFNALQTGNCGLLRFPQGWG